MKGTSVADTEASQMRPQPRPPRGAWCGALAAAHGLGQGQVAAKLIQVRKKTLLCM